MRSITVKLLCLVLAFVVAAKVNAQVTSSSITGTVLDSAGNYLEGATVTATHQPSGTVYTTLSRKGGSFVIPSARIGGPYSVKIEFVGYKPYEVDGINLILGEPYSINAVMGQDFKSLASVVISVQRRRSAVDKTGASTNVGQRLITSLPTISRSITDFTRLTPQANGNSFAGRDGRYNNVQVDGANLNNNFGLSSDLLPGGGNQPISLDAIEELSINIAPYDVRQSGFTGAGVNAVTKSGTNTFRGTAYTYYRDQSFNGRHINNFKLAEQQKQKNEIYGLTFGGPIIKNKLFFFVSGELEERTFPGITWSPTGGSGSGNVSNTHIDSLRKLSEFLKSQYGYETGAYDNFPDFTAKNHKVLGKIDWNISADHKLTLKYNELVSNNDVALNSTSVPNGIAGAINYSSTARFGQNAMSFANSNYGFKDIVRSGTLELNSNFKGRFANQFLATLTKIKATRTSPSAVFPFIDILNNNNNNYMSAGYEPYSFNNDVINDVYSVIDNFTYFAGKHRLTAGASYEYQRVGNMFMPASQSYYIYNSLDDFINNRAPRGFALTYSLVPGEESVYSAELKLGQLGIYAQDEIAFNERFKMTFGLRLDRPIYHQKPLENPAITALTLPDEDGNQVHYSTGAWPRSSFYWSPRIGFRWDPEGNKSMIVRGGTGLFTGKIPFVWLTNMPTNSGMYQFSAAVSDPTTLQEFLFNPDPAAYRNKFPSNAGTSVPSAGIVLINPNFKFPQVWRTNLAFDKSFGNGWLLTMEALITKDVNGIRMRNANQKEPNGTLTGPDNRARYNPANNGNRRIYSGINNAIVLENTNKGGGFSFTTQISKNIARGLSGMIAYTYTFSQDITPNPGSQAASVWSANPTSGTQNDIELAYSQFAVPHRIVGTISYRAEYLKHLATTVSLFYEASAQGVFSYAYNGDVNGDGNSGSVDLMYIPKDPSEIIFVNQSATSSLNAYTAKEQSDAFFAYIQQDKYLSKHMGQYAERNGARFPWYHRLDFKLLQDIFTTFGDRKHTLQLSVDVLNFANLLNKSWGVRKQLNYTNGFQSNPLVFDSYDPSGQPRFRMAQVSKQLATETFSDVRSTSSTWGLQVGLRYIF